VFLNLTSLIKPNKTQQTASIQGSRKTYLRKGRLHSLWTLDAVLNSMLLDYRRVTKASCQVIHKENIIR